ncbi:MAG TPA: hypothetical protein VF911_02635 [Thermoanaerobaculia bacterium]|jgi:hypothetical protein
MSRWIALAAALMLAAACTRPPADELTIELSRDDESAVVTAQTALDSDAARDAALAGSDPWAVRFARVSSELERTTFQKTRGTLDRVTRTIRIPRRDLQQVFADTSITVQLVSGDGWSELTFYPGTSTRASREEQRHFNDALSAWSADAARYYEAVHRLYTYMDANPDRALPLYEALLTPIDEEPPPLFEEEQPYVDQLLRTMDDLAGRMDEEEVHAARLAEEADLIFNPFPARITVRVPGEEKPLVIEPVELFESLKSLEGRWISPDPLIAFLREENLTAEQLARQPRRATFNVSATDIASAVREQLTKPRTLSIRWRD